MSRIRAVLAVSLLLLATTSYADTIEYSVDDLGGGSWQYNYTINNTGANVIEWFAVIFDLGLYENLVEISSPADWDTLILQPDSGLPDDGYFDSLTFAGGVAPGDMLGGFSVSFDFLGTGTPGDQFFDIYDLGTIDDFDIGIIGGGLTTRVDVVPVPEPATLGLFAIGLFLMATFAKRRRRPTLELHSQ